MCGIFSLFNINYNELPLNSIMNAFSKGYRRGPENSSTKHYINSFFGFHRLAINGLTDTSNQPIEIDNIFLYCNGEIFNYKELYKLLGITPQTESDCEVIIHLYKKYGIEYTLQLLHGEYAFIILDCRLSNTSLENYIHIARDPFGVRPLFTFLVNIPYTPVGFPFGTIGFASEMKSLIDVKNMYDNSIISQFKPGCYSTFTLGNMVNAIWRMTINEKGFYTLPACNISHTIDNTTINDMFALYLKRAVITRCENSERPVACLLSGGLDSSTVAAIANNHFRSQGKKLQTFSIGLKDSDDLAYARQVAEYLDTQHHECIIEESNLLDMIKEVIHAIESYDTTTVRASIGNYLIGKFIRENSDCKVILNGDGADELLGGYLYFHNYKNDIDFDNEIKHLLSNIHFFDVLRSDRCIAAHGLEPRTPFLDNYLVNFYLSLPVYLRNHNNKNQMDRNQIERNQMEKQLLRDTVFSMFNDKGEKILPKEIIYRKKEAFSDGVSSQKRTFFTVIQEAIQKEMAYPDISGVEIEKKYYRYLFDEQFFGCRSIIPYLWMPKFAQTEDPSARLLDVYNI